MDFVLDCSVTVAWCFEDQATDYTRQVLASLANKTALVPAIWSYEVSNVLLIAQRRKKISPSVAAHFLELLGKLPIVLLEENHLKFREGLLTLGQAYQLSSYDTAYLKQAMNQGLALATLDHDLQKACKNAGVKLYKV